MKFTEQTLQPYLKKGWDSLKGLLVFGTDEGGVADLFLQVTQSFKEKDSAIDIVDITADILKNTPEKIYSESVSSSFFSDIKLIRIFDPDVGFEKILDDLTKRAGCSAFFLIRADNLKKGTKLRTFCEDSPHIGAIACYPDDAGSVQRIVSAWAQNNALTISKEGQVFLQTHLGTNRSQIRQELDKILMYLGEDRNLDAETVRQVLTDGTEVDMMDVALALTDQNPNRLPVLFRTLFQEGKSPISLIRVTLTHLRQIYMMKQWVKTGLSALAAVKKVIPYVFFKTEGAYLAALSKWTESALVEAMQDLMQAEKICKSESTIAHTVVQKTFLEWAGLKWKK